MGHKIQRTIYNLHFPEDSVLDGATVKVRSVNLRTYFQMNELGEDESLESVSKLFEILVKQIKSWDLEDEDGTPLPIEANTLLDMEPATSQLLTKAFFQAVTGVDPTSGNDSPSGDRSLEASLPMAAP